MHNRSCIVANGLAVLLIAVGAEANTGHCTFTQQGRFGPHAACEWPVEEEICTELGQRHTDAEYASGACPTEDLVGTCDKGSTKLLYYEGDAENLAIGCGFQGGTWIRP